MRWVIVIIFFALSVVLAIRVVRHLWLRGGLEINDVIGLLGVSVSIVIAVLASPLTLARPTPTVISTPTKQGEQSITMLPLTPLTSAPTETPQVTPPTLLPISSATLTTTATSIAVFIATLTQPPIVQTPTLNPLPTITSPSITSTETATTQPTNTPLLSPTITATAIMTGEFRIRVEGIGAASETVTNPTLRERSAFLAAEVDAKRKLAEWITGAVIESLTIVDQGVVTTDTIRQTVKATVPASKVIAQHYYSETGTATITLELVINKASLP